MDSWATPTLAEILEALSHALDMTEGQPRGHAARTCLIAQRIADELLLQDRLRDDLFFAALLKDAGCSANATRIQQTFGGDELRAKRNVKFIDWSNPLKAAGFAIANAEVGAPPVQRCLRLLKMIGPPSKAMDDATEARCDRGAGIARRLGFGNPVADAIYSLDEHWDGRGSPEHRTRYDIPVLARILCLAQTLDLFVTERGRPSAYAMLDKRKGKWFDPELVRAAEVFRWDEVFWCKHAGHKLGQKDIEVHSTVHSASPSEVDEICSAFADIVDAKSGFTAEHSQRVTTYAVRIARHMGLGEAELIELRRAALLHDIGKLGVSNSILDKPGRLDVAEYERVKQHPRFTYEILSPIRGFRRVADIASAHHERLDGTGYWRNLNATDLDLEMRILCVADVYDAMSAKRPYRDAMPPDQVLQILRKEAETGLDPECVQAAAELFIGSAAERVLTDSSEPSDRIPATRFPKVP